MLKRNDIMKSKVDLLQNSELAFLLTCLEQASSSTRPLHTVLGLSLTPCSFFLGGGEGCHAAHCNTDSVLRQLRLPWPKVTLGPGSALCCPNTCAEIS